MESIKNIKYTTVSKYQFDVFAFLWMICTFQIQCLIILKPSWHDGLSSIMEYLVLTWFVGFTVYSVRTEYDHLF